MNENHWVDVKTTKKNKQTKPEKSGKFQTLHLAGR